MLKGDAAGSQGASGTVESKLVEVYAEPNPLGKDSAGADSTEARRVWSTYESKANDKCWDPIAAPLRLSSPALYKAGCTAVNAVRKLRLSRPIFGIFQFFRPSAAIDTQRLYALTAWGPTEGRSAELGLALALVSSICGVRHRVIVATGALSSTVLSTASTPLLRSDDVKIHPVAQIREKLGALAADIKDGAFREIAGNKELLVLAPRYYKHADRDMEVSKIAEVSTLRELGVKVVTINWLSDATHVLKAYQLQYLAQDRVSQILIGVLFIMSLGFFVWTGWRNAEIPMQFIPATRHALRAEPFEVCTMGNKQFALPIRTISLVPSLPVTAIIGWKTVIGKPSSLNAIVTKALAFEGYYVAIIVVSEYSPITIDYARIENTTVPIRVRPGDTYQGWIQLNERAETNALILMAQRHAPFDADWLRKLFHEQFPSQGATHPSDNRLNIDAATDFIAKLVPGALIYPFLTVMEKSKCFFPEISNAKSSALSFSQP